MPMKLQDISWKYKIWSISLVPLVACIIVGLLAGYFMRSQAQLIEQTTKKSINRANESTYAISAISDLEKGVQYLIAVDESGLIRNAAVGAIKASSQLEEAITKLHLAIPDDRRVADLASNFTVWKSKLVNIIQLARKNADEEALAELPDFERDMSQLRQLSQSLIESENRYLLSVTQESIDKARQIGIQLVVITLVCLFFGIAVTAAAIRLLIGPLTRIQDHMNAMASGDLRIQNTLRSEGSDEIASISTAMNNNISTLNSIVKEIHSQATELDAGSSNINSASSSMTTLSGTIKESVEVIKSYSAELVELSGHIIDGVTTTATTADGVSRQSRETADHINSKMDQLATWASTIERITHHSQQTSESVNDISQISQSINDISEQTNLLSLNAAIEAARAGEQGRGFAIVADEVRSLAKRSSNAVKEISKIAATITAKVSESCAMLHDFKQQTSATIADMSEVANQITAVSKSIANLCATLNELGLTIAQVDHKSSDISEQMHPLVAMSEESNSNAEALNEITKQMILSAEKLRTQVDHFKIHF